MTAAPENPSSLAVSIIFMEILLSEDCGADIFHMYLI